MVARRGGQAMQQQLRKREAWAEGNAQARAQRPRLGLLRVPRRSGSARPEGASEITDLTLSQLVLCKSNLSDRESLLELPL